MITLTLEKRYHYLPPKSVQKNTIMEYIALLEKPLKKVVESFWTVLNSPVEKS